MTKLIATLNKETNKTSYFVYVGMKGKFKRISENNFKQIIKDRLPNEILTLCYTENEKYKREHISF